MTPQDLRDGPWMVFPCRCTHGCGPFYTWDQVRATPCQPDEYGVPMHHDFAFPQARA